MNEINFSQPSIDDIWSEYFRPQTAEDLCIHHDKVKMVMGWFQEVYKPEKVLDAFQDGQGNSHTPRIIVLKGPSGSGKSSVIRALANDFGVDVVSFHPSTSFLENYEESFFVSDNNGLHVQGCIQNQLNSFRAFIYRYHRFLSTDQEDSAKSRLLLFEELPNGFYMKPQLYREIIKNFIRQFPKHTPLVFIFSYIGVQSAQGETYQLFPNSFIQEVNGKIWEFNPVAPTILTKALKRVNEIARLTHEEIKKIVESSGGDLRCAFNILEMTMKYSRNCNGKSSLITCRDAPLTSFHFFGKILYAKRVKDSKSMDIEDDRYYPLVDNPDDLMKQCSFPRDKVALSLHQNYILRTKATIEEAARCIDDLSVGDFIGSTSNKFSISDFTEKLDTFSSYQNEISCRGILYHIPPTLVDLAGKSIEKGGGLIKQESLKFYELQRKQEELQSQIQQKSSLLLSGIDCKSTSFFLDIVAFHPLQRSDESIAGSVMEIADHQEEEDQQLIDLIEDVEDANLVRSARRIDRGLKGDHYKVFPRNKSEEAHLSASHLHHFLNSLGEQIENFRTSA